MSEDTVLPFDLPSDCRKKLSVAFDGGMLSSDAGALLLGKVEKRLGIVTRLAACLRDKRDPDLIEHTLEEMLRLFAIASGYEDADDCDSLRHDPIFKMAVGRLPETGERLCSQPTMSRLENAPSKIEIARAMVAMADQFCKSYRRVPASITLDIDDTFDAVHGHQQLSLFNAHYGERCFLPIHIYEGTSGKPVAVILREGKTPAGVEVRTILKHVIGHIPLSDAAATSFSNVPLHSVSGFRQAKYTTVLPKVQSSVSRLTCAMLRVTCAAADKLSTLLAVVADRHSFDIV